MSGELQSSSRRAELQALCELQRMALAEQVAGIERRVQKTDAALGAIRNILARPAVLAGGLALLLTARRSRWWSMLSRGLITLATARRAYQALKRK